MTSQQTIEDHGYQTEDWQPVFQPLENAKTLEDKNVPELLEQDTRNIGGHEQPVAEGGQFTYHSEDGVATFELRWGPRYLEEGQIAHGSLDLHGEIDGQPVRDLYEEIVEEHGTDYIESVNDTDGLAATIDLPENYDQQEWQQTVNAVDTIIEEANEVQTQLHNTLENYPTS